MLKAIVNNQKEFIIESKNRLTINDVVVDWDMIQTKEVFHIIKNDKSFNIEVIKVDRTTKTYHLRINHKIYTVVLKDKADQILEQSGINLSSAAAVKEIKAPMPGLILQFFVEEGTTVKKGDPMLILEAMKMENLLKSPRDGVIKSIKVAKGQSVEKNQILIEF